MADPLVVQIMDAFRIALLLREVNQRREMARRWIQLEDALEAEQSALARVVAEQKEQGRVISVSSLFKLDRYTSLLRLLRVQLDGYSDFANGKISGEQEHYGRLGIEQGVAAIRASTPRSIIGTFFDVLPVGAIENMVGLAGDGSPLRTLLQTAWPDAVDGLTNALLKGVALGRNPRDVARDMRAGVSHGLDRMLNIARTEQLRVYRESNRQQYIHSGVVTGYLRLAARNDHTCPACLAADGEFYELSEILREHPQGRCALLPLVQGMQPPQWKRGSQWFAEQDADTQRKILGPGRFDAWQAGQFEFEQLVTVRRNSTWGDSVQPTPLKDLVN